MLWPAQALHGAILNVYGYAGAEQRAGLQATNVMHATMNAPKSYFRLDDVGVYRVGDTRVMLDSVVAAFHQGHSPETIRQQYPALSLAEVYGTIAQYLAHRQEIDEYLRHQDLLWERERARSERQPSPVAERLRSMCKGGSAEAT